jgi:hypothetical protein
MSRPISDAWFHRIKASTRDLVKACGGVVRAGEICHASKTEVSRWQSATDGDVIGIAAALALVAECGVAYVTSAMADIHGQRLTDPANEPQKASAVFARHAEFIRAVSEAIAVGATVQADGDLTAAEAEQIDRQYSEALRRLNDARMAVAAFKGGQGGLKVVGG